MASIPLSDLEPGSRLAYDVCDPTGRLLLSARTPISEDVLRALHRREITDLIFREADELGEDGPKRTWLMAGVAEPGERNPPPVMVIAHEVAPPKKVSDAPPPKLSHIRAAFRRAADSVITARQPRWNRLPRRIEADAHALNLNHFAPQGTGLELSVESRNERVQLIDRVFKRLSAGQPVEMGVLTPIIDELCEDSRRDPLALLRMAIASAAETDDLATHAYAVAGVCTIIAGRLGWADADVRSAALAGLLADCGLTLLPYDIRVEPRPLTDVEINSLHRHTAWSAALIELLNDDGEHALDEIVQLAVYQHHEREDGTGYPTRARSGSIHDLSRLVAVSDTFVGLLSPRAHRPGLSVERALAEVVRGANNGSLSPTIARGLILALGVRSSKAPAPAVVTRVQPARVAA